MERGVQSVTAGIVLFLLFSCASEPRVYEVPSSDISAPRIPKEELHEPSVPEQPEVEAEYKERVEYTIRPEKGHVDATGMIKIEKISSENGPETVFLMLEKREIDHADTKWYTFTLAYNGLTRKVEGEKSIPYVRGSRSLWWNEVQLHLDESLEGTLEITVIDDYADRTYRFTVEKTVEKIPVEKGGK